MLQLQVDTIGLQIQEYKNSKNQREEAGSYIAKNNRDVEEAEVIQYCENANNLAGNL